MLIKLHECSGKYRDIVLIMPLIGTKIKIEIKIEIKSA